jgi:hypothetical protein
MTFMSLFLLAIVVFTVKVFATASSAYEDKIERLCAPKQESKWAYLAPPMEKNNVWTDAEASRKEMCKSRREGDSTTDGSRHPE